MRYHYCGGGGGGGGGGVSEPDPRKLEKEGLAHLEGELGFVAVLVWGPSVAPREGWFGVCSWTALHERGTRA